MPRYEHDCDRCIFLGEDGIYDLYYCDRTPTVVCRYGNEGREYGSGLVFALTIMEGGKTCYRNAMKLALKTEFRERIIAYMKKYELGEFPERHRRFLEILKEVDDEKAV